MKKIFGISLFALLAISPIMAGAEVVAGDPGATTSSAAAASATPKYALKNSADTDGNAATAGYVKGAYNAIIKGINATQGEIDTINTNIGTYENTVSHLLDNTATQDGTVATIKAATSTEQIASSSVNITGVTTSSISATASGDVNLAVPVMDNWANDSEATTPVATTTSFSGLNVSGLSMSAPGTSNTATLTKSGISGTVSVTEYLSGVVAAPTYNYTPLISTDPNSYGYNDGRYSENADGLANGEWKATWTSYGTAKGTTKCSVIGEDGSVEDFATSANISDTAGGGCWCKLTGFTDNNNTTYNQSSLWVFNGTYPSASDCAYDCAHNCADSVSFISDFRSVLFGSVQ
ncbi:MAG: hypothetical protein IKF41_02230 [Alphaproteobacteria bacterium]|nr:hypothetical protein [Alphaproteobacteria bacterium]